MRISSTQLMFLIIFTLAVEPAVYSRSCAAAWDHRLLDDLQWLDEAKEQRIALEKNSKNFARTTDELLREQLQCDDFSPGRFYLALFLAKYAVELSAATSLSWGAARALAAQQIFSQTGSSWYGCKGRPFYHAWEMIMALARQQSWNGAILGASGVAARGKQQSKQFLMEKLQKRLAQVGLSPDAVTAPSVLALFAEGCVLQLMARDYHKVQLRDAFKLAYQRLGADGEAHIDALEAMVDEACSQELRRSNIFIEAFARDMALVGSRCRNAARNLSIPPLLR